jgi:hypothetical protein
MEQMRPQRKGESQGEDTMKQKEMMYEKEEKQANSKGE